MIDYLYTDITIHNIRPMDEKFLRSVTMAQSLRECCAADYPFPGGTV
jgi:hypothetical protein